MQAIKQHSNSKNKRRTIEIAFGDEMLTVKELSELFNVNRNTIYSRIRRGQPVITEDEMNKLNRKNYYSLGMDRQYMSVSLVKKFTQCEASTMAYLNGEYIEFPNAAMLVGSYTHAAFESDSAFKEF